MDSKIKLKNWQQQQQQQQKAEHISVRNTHKWIRWNIEKLLGWDSWAYTLVFPQHQEKPNNISSSSPLPFNLKPTKKKTKDSLGSSDGKKQNGYTSLSFFCFPSSFLSVKGWPYSHHSLLFPLRHGNIPLYTLAQNPPESHHTWHDPISWKEPSRRFHHLER